MLKMQNVITILILKALKVIVINIAGFPFYIYKRFPHICVLIFINLKVYPNISKYP